MPKNSEKNWLSYSGVGIQMVLTMMLCWWIGEKLEIFFEIKTPIGQISGIFIGLFGSMYSLIKSVNN